MINNCYFGWDNIYDHSVSNVYDFIALESYKSTSALSRESEMKYVFWSIFIISKITQLSHTLRYNLVLFNFLLVPIHIWMDTMQTNF